MGKVRHQDNQAAGHTASAARRQAEMNAGAPPSFSFLFRVQLMDDATHHAGQVFPTQLSLSANALKDMPEDSLSPM